MRALLSKSNQSASASSGEENLSAMLQNLNLDRKCFGLVNGTKIVSCMLNAM